MMGPRDFSRINRSSEGESEDEEEAQGEDIEEREGDGYDGSTRFFEN